MARRALVRHIKSHRSYTLQEAADCVGVTIQTVRRWAKNGLRVMASQRPFLILGADLKTYVSNGRNSNEGPMPVGRFHCLKCKEKEPPALGLVEYRPLSGKHGILHGFCGSCEGPVSRIVSRTDLPAWAATCEIDGSTEPRP